MADRKPPLAIGERDILHTALQFQRESLLRSVKGLSEEDARRSLVDSGTTLLWLTQHVRFAERIWIRSRFAGEAVELGRATVPSATLAEAIDGYRSEWSLVDAVIEAHDLSEATDDPNGGELPVTLRWIVTHLLEEVARHAGHADILRELIDGETGR